MIWGKKGKRMLGSENKAVTESAKHIYIYILNLRLEAPNDKLNKKKRRFNPRSKITGMRWRLGDFKAARLAKALKPLVCPVLSKERESRTWPGRPDTTWNEGLH